MNVSELDLLSEMICRQRKRLKKQRKGLLYQNCAFVECQKLDPHAEYIPKLIVENFEVIGQIENDLRLLKAIERKLFV